jgi:sulfite exporter TauE/SafE
MIIALGVALLARVFRRGGARLSAHRHSHGSLEHWHPHLHYGPAEVSNVPGTHHHPVAVGRRPFLVGMMHGLAGSATLVLLVLAELPTPMLGILYLLVFGIGSIAGMMIMSLAVALPYRIVARRFARVEHGLRLAAALLGIAVGVMMVYQIGVVDGLFRAAAGLL